MKTITFYSYKGGVGRSLALSNIATMLSQYKKKVCVIDFDLDAPGLRFKFKDYSFDKEIKKGIVDYIFEFSHNNKIPSNISEYTVSMIPNDRNSEPINFISAGDIENSDYWKKLSQIKWSEMFYSDKAQGIRFFLDLKAKIEKELKPDILLIDSRTGITDISGITLRIFADEIVVLAVNNLENIFGSKKILKSLVNQSSSLLKKMPQVRFCLTRLPYTDTPQDKEKEYSLVESLKAEFKSVLNVDKFDISVIHSDKRLEEEEKQLILYNYDNKDISISNDYLKLFDLLTSDILSPEEIIKFHNLKQAELEFSLAMKEEDNAKKLIHLDKAIRLNDKQFSYYQQRGYVYYYLKEYELALTNYLMAHDLNPVNDDIIFPIALIYFNFNNYEKSLDYFDKLRFKTNYTQMWKSMVLKKVFKFDEALSLLNSLLYTTPNDHILLNSRADLLRNLKNHEPALTDIYKAIEINPSEAVYFATLAEIFADMGNLENFYLNLAIALSKGLTASPMNDAKDVYEKFKNEERFTSLIAKYKLDINEILK